MKTIKIALNELDFRFASTINQKKEFAKLALKNRLYVSGWQLFKELNLISKYAESDIVICSYMGIVIAVHVCDETGFGMWFCRMCFRKNGIAKRMTQIMQANGHRKMSAGTGRKDCTGFFQKVNVELLW
ncbi:MAG: hypothetical protein PHU53_07720 [Thermoplasmata archaeon]|nr:hypothetical protein [Thermoplasmata archaeon]